jgi:S-adenosylmethionine decarboxylase
MHGLHLTADLHDCRCDVAWFTEAQALQAWCLAAVKHVGLQAVGHVVHRFPATAEGPGGVTVAVLLAESHLCLHTWPERRAVTADIYVCNFGADHSDKARALMDAVVQRFDAGSSQLRSVVRGA